MFSDCPYKRLRQEHCEAAVSLNTSFDSDTVRPRLYGPLLSGSLAIRKKIVGYRFTGFAMHTHSMCVRLSGSLANPDIFARLCEV